MYDLHRLGWNSFQELCLTITREILGQTVESFLDSNDGGRDGAFAGHWNPTGRENLSGAFVIQCKFTSRANYALRATDLADEVSKVERLVRSGLCDSYLLMTNARLTGKRNEEIKALIRNAGVKHVVLFGSTWIEQQIRDNKQLRMLVPRVYGLGDLSQILDERAYAQARAILESMREDLAKVVVTDAYRRAASALDKHGFVLLIGEPAAGKTTIASLLAMAAADQWSASVLKLDDPRNVVERWNPEEPSQFFWLDDAFGVTQYESFLVHGWNHIFPQIRTMLRKGAKIVMTSRDYIYNRARNDLKESAFPLLKESQVVIDVHNLSADEKQQILYNHLKLGRQPREFRREIKPHLDAIAAHERFVPETARRLADPFFTKDLHLSWYFLERFVEKREDFLQEVLLGLDGHSKAALALIYMRNGGLESPVSLRESEEHAIERLRSSLGECLSALESLRGSLVVHSQASGQFLWQFKHPTIGDAYASILAQSPELLGIFVQGSAPDRLIEQITCGDVGIENAIVIPSALFAQVLDRLRDFSTTRRYKSAYLSTWDAESATKRFLARRCSKPFLSLYLERHPELLDEVSRPGLYLSAVSEVDLAVRLYQLGLLPEEHRKRFVATVSQYALEGQDTYALASKGIRSVFREEEFRQLLRDVRSRLIPKLEDVRDEVISSRGDYRMSAADYIHPFIESLNTLEKCFGDDRDARSIIERERREVEEWISYSDTDDVEREPRSYGRVSMHQKPQGTRSIFDDIDA